MTRWAAYPAYKSADADWLHEIPMGWTTKRLKWVFEVHSGSTPRTTEPAYWDGEIPWITPNDLGQLRNDTIVETERSITERGYRSCGATIVPVGSLILSTRAPIGHLAIAGVDVCTNQGCRALEPRVDDDTRFFYYQLTAIRPILRALGSGSTFVELGTDDLESFTLAYPSLPEQRAIADLLDRQTTKIDTVIRKQQQLIELLEEKRAALISHAVTKGLDPDVPMRDSGVPWLGQIPEHWDTVLLKRLARIRYGLGQPPAESSTGVPFIRATNVKHGRISEKEMMYVDREDVPDSRDAVLDAGEIIVVRSGAYTGDSTIIPERYQGAIAGYDMILRVQKGFAPYIAWQLLSPAVYELQFGFHKLRAAQPHLNAEELGNTVVVFPPSDEQRAIAAHLERHTSRIDGVINKGQKMIERLQEYRTALISAAVTGKIDVRDQAPPA